MAFQRGERSGCRLDIWSNCYEGDMHLDDDGKAPEMGACDPSHSAADS